MAYAPHPLLRCTTLLLALLGNVLAAPVFAEDDDGHDGIVVMEWSVRQDIHDLLLRLNRRDEASPELLDTTQALLAQYGNRPYQHQRRYRPVSDIIRDILQERGMDQAFQRQFATVAERELNQALGDWNETNLLSVAMSYPHTPAAEAAWSHLAQRAWNTGRLGLFLTWARRGGGAPPEQIAAAQALLDVDPIPHLPADLAPLGRMWGLTIPALSDSDGEQDARHQARPGAMHIRDHRSDEPPLPLRFSARSNDGVMALSDGRHLALFDPLMGNLIAPPVRLGRHSLAHHPATTGTDRFIAIGVDERRRYHLSAVASSGEVTWRSRLPYHQHSSLISDPVVIDHVVGLALSERQGDGSQIRLLGLHLHDGAILFDHAIAKDTRNVRNHWGGQRGRNSPQPPALTAHAGTFALSSGSGLIATLAADGSVTGIWSSRSTVISPLDDSPGRPTGLHSDGRYLVTSNRHDGVLTIIRPHADEQQGEPSLQRYTGNGAADILLAVRNGLALTSGRRITLIDLATQEVRWSAPSNSGGATAWGHIGDTHVLVAAGSILSLIDRTSGQVIDERFFERDAAITSAAGMVISAMGEHLIGYGDREAFMRRLRDDMRRNPNDYRPLASLYALHRAQGDHEQAFSYAWQALQRGAPERFAEEAAMILRERLHLALGSDSFADHLQRLRQLGSMLSSLDHEAWWWQGRQHEQRQRHEAAGDAFRQVLAQPRQRIRLANGLAADSHALAQAGLARLQQAETPTWAKISMARTNDTPPTATDTTATTSWSDDDQRLGEPMLDPQQHLLVGYHHGDLQAQRTSDGSIAWRRPIQPDDRSFLGLSFAPDVGGEQRPGLAIDVIIGTAAAGAGFRDGDRMLHFGDTAIHQPQDLIDAILRLPAGAAFEAEIERRGSNGSWHSHTIRGRLGARMQQPVAISSQLVVTQAVTLGGHPRHQQLVPDPEDLSLRVLALENGRELLRLRLDDDDGPGNTGRLRDVIIIGDMVLLEIAGELQAYNMAPLLRQEHDIAEHAPPQPMWRLPSIEGALQQPRILGEHYLLVEQHQEERLHIIDLQQGRTIFDLPAHSTSGALMDRGDLIVAEGSQRTTAWDLGRGLRRWSQDGSGHTPVALHGDTVYTLNEHGHITLLERANGRQRRVVSGVQLVEHAQAWGQRLWVHARNSEGRQLVAAVSMDSGTVAWQRLLPPGSEIRGGLNVDRQGLTFQLSSQSHHNALVTLASDGSLRGAITTPSFGFVRILNDGRALIFDNQRLSIDSSTLPNKAPTIHMPTVPSGPPSRMVEAASQGLQWQSIAASSRWAAFSIEQRLGIVVELDRSTTHMHMYLGNQGPEMDPYGQRLAISRGEAPTLTTHPQGWRLNAFHRLGDDESGRWRALLVLHRAGPVAMAGNVEVLVTSNHDRRDDLPWPWWLRRLWSPLHAGSTDE